MKTTQRTVRISNKDWRALEHVAISAGYSINEYINNVLKEHFKQKHNYEWQGIPQVGNPNFVKKPTP